MFKNKSDNRNNLSGIAIAKLRKSQSKKMSQRMLAEQLQLRGIDVDKNAIQRIESGQRFITDIELYALAQVFQTTCDALILGSLQSEE